ncbi:hypothetical protein [Accumulibacter sp.]|jgi:hypothetical protein|uniref:hypothetical protein n=1 Tax=Accumulibacter sp. TaxID=2053492 RepID=UPI00044A05F0|nr:hypothetical protein [Accumulibacter sp.]MCB1965577.1 hypothetical protein [Accumulibacter sp.]MCP5230353.1 hypothetical protein [Accumulibacter sp.]HRE71591.1 hypothetical protein [Accumulibacter sp.]HRL74721.1 hypothetical protein [Candidatus Accumulibacter phosphatis]
MKHYIGAIVAGASTYDVWYRVAPEQRTSKSLRLKRVWDFRFVERVKPQEFSQEKDETKPDGSEDHAQVMAGTPKDGRQGMAVGDDEFNTRQAAEIPRDA